MDMDATIQFDTITLEAQGNVDIFGSIGGNTWFVEYPDVKAFTCNVKYH